MAPPVAQLERYDGLSSTTGFAREDIQRCTFALVSIEEGMGAKDRQGASNGDPDDFNYGCDPPRQAAAQTNHALQQQPVPAVPDIVDTDKKSLASLSFKKIKRPAPAPKLPPRPKILAPQPAENDNASAPHQQDEDEDDAPQQKRQRRDVKRRKVVASDVESEDDDTTSITIVDDVV
ncbi:hypothetical protein GGG16DRAFT_116117 [Schizophyllum commune]